MPTIRATCGQCGDVELVVADLQVRVCRADNQGTYTFRCPECRMTVVKPAEPRVVDLLVASGVALATWDLPAELFEFHEGAVLTHDDLLDFHELLATESWFDELHRQTPLGPPRT